MSHIHIALVGNETYPVYSVIRFLNPDTIYLICSDGPGGSINEARTIVSNLKGEKDDIQIVTMDPANFEGIYKGIDSLQSNFTDGDYITLNITGGTKFWALAFYKTFCNRPDTQLFLFNQNNSLWNLLTNTCTDLQGLDLDTIISLYGNNTTSFTKLDSYTDKDDESMRKIESARHFNPKAFVKLAAALDPNNSQSLRTNPSGIFSDSAGNTIMWSKPDQAVISFKNKGMTKTYRLDSPNAVSLLFNSGWFEYKVAKLLSGWEKVKEIRMNCIFPLNPNYPKNEVDIIVNTDIKPVFVECKTAVHTATDIDKFATVVSNYGGAACKALFVTEKPMKDLPATKCKESNIATFSLEGHSEGDLYSFLDFILMESNK